MIKPVAAFVLSAVVLAGCAEKGKESPAAEIQAAIHAHTGEPKLTVITMVNNRTGAGAHTSLLVQGSQSVMFDPAGSFIHERVPERAYVLYGMSPAWVKAYKSAHARSEFHVVSQEFNVSPAVAAQALQLVQANGPVASAHCAHATSAIPAPDTGVSIGPSGVLPAQADGTARSAARGADHAPVRG
jgi:hypothetical protein